MTSRMCSIPDCGKPHNANGFCSTHQTRYRKHGNPFTVLPHRGRAPRAKGWDITYRSAHARIVYERGRPSRCEFCGTTEERGPRGYQWALPHETQDYIVIDAQDRVYCIDPDVYIRLCSACHGQYDQANVPRGHKQADRFCGS